MFVALANFATGADQIENSSDGVAWTARSSAADGSGGYALAFGLGVFVSLCFAADGQTSIALVSSDGVTWSSYAVPQPNIEYQGLTFSAALGLFVGIDSGDGVTAVVITSPDGVNWTHTASIPQGVTDTDFYEGLTAGPSLLVAVGDSSGSGLVVATSPDGTVWTKRAGAGTGKDWNAVCFGESLYVAVCGTSANHQVMTSPDGVTWTLQVTPTPRQFWTGVTFGGGLYVAVGHQPSGAASAQIMTSPDGVTWTKQTPPANSLELHGVSYGDGLFVAVGFGTAGRNVMTSPDGVTWTLQTSAISDLLQAVAFGSAAAIAQTLSIALYGYKIVPSLPPCALVEVEDLPPVPRVL